MQYSIHATTSACSTSMRAVLVCALLLQLVQAIVYNGPLLSSQRDVIVLGALFPVHKNEDNQCGDILDLGLQRLEAMVLAVSNVNNDFTLLPDVTLTFEIRDTCTQPNYALEQSLDFVSARGVRNGTVLGVSGVVGAASSSVSIAVASLLRLFKIPQISYASTAETLSDRTRFDYFFRTIPPDSLQTQVMADLIGHFNWSYVYLIHSDDVYGTVGIQALLNALENCNNCSSKACVATRISVPEVATIQDLDNVIAEMSDDWVSNATVAVLFGQLATAVSVLEAVGRARMEGVLTNNITWIASDAWGDQIPAHLYPVAHGMLAILPLAKHSQAFDDYFTALTPLNNAANPWFAEYWEAIFNCSTSNVSGLRVCDAEDRLTPENGYRQNSKVPFAIDAVYAFAHAMTDMQRDLCGGSGLCSAMMDARSGSVHGELLLQYLHNVSFSPVASALEISFDASGDEQGSFLIKNLQWENDVYSFREVGEWAASDSTLELLSAVEWTADGDLPISVCSQHCGGGQYPERVSDQAACCWVCKPCLGNRHVSTGDVCVECERGFAPNVNKTVCDLIPLTFLTWSHVWSIFIMMAAVVGVVLTVCVIVIFVVYGKHQIVKGSSRELSAFLLTGLLLGYLLPFAFIIRPSPVVCAIRRFGVGFCFTLCYSALLIKTNRIHRIFNRPTGSVTTPSLISPQSQVLLTLLLIAVQIVIEVVWFVLEPPSVLLVYDDTSTELKCGESPYIGISVSFGYSLFLLLLSTYFAFRARKVPQNFNEAKFINLTLYTIVIIWLAFIPTYFATSQLGTIYQTSSLVLGITLSASTTLCCLFAPKIYFLFSQLRKEGQEGQASSDNSSNRRPRQDSISSSGGTQLIHPDKRKPSIYGELMA